MSVTYVLTQGVTLICYLCSEIRPADVYVPRFCRSVLSLPLPQLRSGLPPFVTVEMNVPLRSDDRLVSHELAQLFEVTDRRPYVRGPQLDHHMFGCERFAESGIMAQITQTTHL